MLEWKQNSDKLRADPEFSGALSTYFDGDAGLNLADAVDAELRESGVAGGLAAASNDQTKQALSAVLSEDRPTVFFRDLISVHGKVETATVGGQEIDLYTAPVFLATIRVDHSAFPVDLENESDPATRTDRQQDIIDNTRAVAIEEYARDIQDILRGDQQFIAVWGLAIDDNLTSDESFEATVPFLLGAFTLILLLVGAMLRSYWAAALAAVMLGLALLWARMISNLLGFEDSIILDVIVPIATISFGVDFMIHAVGRCREELAGGQSYRSAYVIGIAAVGGALVLRFQPPALPSAPTPPPASMPLSSLASAPQSPWPRPSLCLVCWRPYFSYASKRHSPAHHPPAAHHAPEPAAGFAFWWPRCLARS